MKALENNKLQSLQGGIACAFPPVGGQNSACICQLLQSTGAPPFDDLICPL